MAGADVLLVEDNQGDVRLVEMAFEQADVPGEVHVVKTGDEPLDWLFRREGFAEAPRPVLVLLDLNLPGTSGHTILDAVKSEPVLKRIPVVVLTSSQSDDDLVQAYEACANACVIKPVDPNEFIRVVQTVVDFWLTTVTLPPVTDGDDAIT